MKIIKIEKVTECTYFVTQSPNILEKLFGVKEKVTTYYYYNNLNMCFTVLYHNTPELNNCIKKYVYSDKMCKVLNKYEKTINLQ